MIGTPINGGVVCREPMRETHRAPEGMRWCFRCRRRTPFWFVITEPTGMSWYGPTPSIRCGECNAVDGDLFPGRAREWP